MELPKIRTALIAAAALAAAGCGGRDDAADAVPEAVEGNLGLARPANDASAREMVAGAEEPAPPSEPLPDAGVNAAGPAGETGGGDTGGNTLDSNVAGM